jgi:hypothetical protein
MKHRCHLLLAVKKLIFVQNFNWHKICIIFKDSPDVKFSPRGLLHAAHKIYVCVWGCASRLATAPANPTMRGEPWTNGAKRGPLKAPQLHLEFYWFCKIGWRQGLGPHPVKTSLSPFKVHSFHDQRRFVTNKIVNRQ